ncbi:glycosyltransferase family 2 protein [Pseudomonadota bacterium]
MIDTLNETRSDPMHQPEVSVIIPAFNAEPFIAQSIQSVLNQSFSDFELIVVDNLSTDKTAMKAEQFEDPRVHVIKCHKQGAAAARNQGFANAAGKYIQFLDADDMMAANKIELQLKVIKVNDPVRTIASCAWSRFEGETDKASLTPEPVWTITDPIEWIVCSLSGGGMMHSGAWLVHRDLITAAGPWDESLSLHDDGEFYTRILLQAESQQFVADTQVFYRNVAGSLSRARSPEAINSAFRVCQLRDKHLLEHCDNRQTRQAVATQYAQFAYEFSDSAVSLVRSALERIKDLGEKPVNTIGGIWFRELVRIIGFERTLFARSFLKPGRHSAS